MKNLLTTLEVSVNGNFQNGSLKIIIHELIDTVQIPMAKIVVISIIMIKVSNRLLDAFYEFVVLL